MIIERIIYNILAVLLFWYVIKLYIPLQLREPLRVWTSA